MKKILSVALMFAAFALVGCKKKDDNKLKIANTRITLTSGATETIVVKPSADGCLFTPENELIAYVNPNGVVTGVTIGVTYITVTNSAKGFSEKVEVTVNPVHDLFRQPRLVFGSTIAQVKEYETRTIDAEDLDWIGYKGENPNIVGLIYQFDIISPGLDMVTVVTPKSTFSATLDFIEERFVYLGYDEANKVLLFISNDLSIGVIMDHPSAKELPILMTNYIALDPSDFASAASRTITPALSARVKRAMERAQEIRNK